MRRIFILSGKISIVIFWMVMMGLLVKKEFFLPSLSTSLREGKKTLLKEIPFRQQWMGIYYGEKKIGYSHTSINPYRSPELSGYAVRNQTVFLLSLLGETREVVLEGFTVIDNRYRLRLFNVYLRFNADRICLKGKVREEKLFLTMEAPGVKKEKVVPIEGEFLLSNTLMPYLVIPRLVPGLTYTVNLIDPLTLSVGQAKIKVEREGKMDRRRVVYRVKLDYRGFSTTSWIAEDGEILREESPLGWIMKVEEKEEALAVSGEGLCLEEMGVPFSSLLDRLGETDD